MSATAASLRELHELHQRISRLRDQIERGPRQLEAKRKHSDQRTEALEKAKAELKSYKVKAHEKETERKGIDNRIAQLQLQINTAKSNKEYSTLVTEKEAAAKVRAALEDQILEFLLKEEERTKDIQSTESEVKRLQQELADLERTVVEKGAELKLKLADSETRLASAEVAMPRDMQDIYRRLVERRGSDSLAGAANGTCTGCYTAITSQMQNQLMLDELVVCKSCGRILYLADAPAALATQ